MQRPKVIFFDAVGTLFGVNGTVGEIYSRFAADVGVSVNAAQLNRSFIDSFRTAPRATFPSASAAELPILEYQWWRAIAQRSFGQLDLLPQLGAFDDFFRPLFDYFETADPWFVYPEVRWVLSQLHQEGVQLAIVSNFDSRLYQVLTALELDHWFSAITISTQVGAAKPSRDIFETALAHHQVPAASVWHVGDSWTEDYQGACSAGLTGIWLNRQGDQTPRTDIQPNHSVSEITCLRALLLDQEPQT